MAFSFSRDRWREYIAKRTTDFSAKVYKDGDRVYAVDSDGKTIAEGEAGVDDASVIQAALDVCGKVFIAKGEYICEALDPPANCEIIGEGRDITILKLPFTATNPIIKPSSTKSNIHIYGMTLDGSNVSGVDIAGNAGGSGWHVSHVKFTNAGRHAFWLGAGSYKTIIEKCIIDTCGIHGIQTSSTPSQEVIIQDLRIYNTNDSALHIYIKNSQVKNIIATNCCGVVDIVEAEGCIIDGVIGIRCDGTVFVEEGSVAGQNCIIDNIYAYRCGSNYYSILISGTGHKIGKITVIEHQSSDRCAVALNGKKLTVDSITVINSLGDGIVLGNPSEECSINTVYVEGCANNGLTIWRSEKHQILGGVIKNTENYGLYINAWEGCRRNLIQGLRIFDDQDTPTQQYGIYIIGPYVNKTTIRDCKVWNNVAQDVYVDSSVTEEITWENVEGYTTENGGTATFSGDGSTTQFSIEHGLVSTPSKVQVTAMSEDASGDFYVTADATYIYVNYKTAPPSGTDNIKLSWSAEV